MSSLVELSFNGMQSTLEIELNNVG